MLLARKIFTATTLQKRNYQVTILGAASEIGQTVSLLLRTQPSISKLVLHDSTNHTPGVVMDVSHIPAESKITGYAGEESLDISLKDSDIILATGGSIMTPGMTYNSWFSSNTSFIKAVAARIAKIAPMAFVGIVTEPVNSIVPMAAEVMRNHGEYNGKKLFGITTVDLFRTQCLYAFENNLHPGQCFVPVIGGHSDKTMIPLLSQATPQCKMNEKAIQEFTSKVRKGDSIVTKAKKGWSPTLSVAFSALVFVRGILAALDGLPVKVNALVENNDFGTSFFSGLVNVDQNGAGEMLRYSNLSKYECQILEQSIAELRKDITMGKRVLEFA